MDISSQHSSPRSIDILLYDGANSLDIAGPMEVFATCNQYLPAAYSLRTVTLDGKPMRSTAGLAILPDGIATLESDASDLLIPGGNGVDAQMGNPKLQTLITRWRESRPQGRVISICSGALLLADAGILDGQTATTHWSRKAQAKTNFPQVDWQIDQLYHQSPTLMTSAGVTSGIDLCLAIVRQDHGAEAALKVARQLVVYVQRAGGQSQFADLLEAQYCENGTLQKLITALIQHPQKDWSLESMSDFAGLTPRTLSRQSAKHLGCPPVQFLERVRVKKASDAIHAGIPLGKVMGLCGFRDSQQMQRAFQRQLGTSPAIFEKHFARPEQA